MRASRSEEALVGNKLTDDLIELAARYASEDCNLPRRTSGATRNTKGTLVKVITKRMLKLAIERAQKTHKNL